MLEVSVIIVNWNTKDFLRDCLQSIPQGIGGIPHEVIVVDNASDDGSCSFIEENFPDVKLIKNSINIGFAAACNEGASSAMGIYLFFLNPDTIVEKDSINRLIKFYEAHSWVGAVGPQLIGRDGKIQNSVRKFPGLRDILLRDTVLGRALPRRKGRMVKRLPDSVPSGVDQISGAGFLIRKDIWRDIGGMDQRFFMFYEEVDLCRRLRESGYKVFYLPSVKVIHLGGGSRHQDRSSVFYYSIKSKFIYLEKYNTRWKILLFKCIYKPLFLIELGFSLIYKLSLGKRVRVERDFVKKYLFSFLGI